MTFLYKKYYFIPKYSFQRFLLIREKIFMSYWGFDDSSSFSYSSSTHEKLYSFLLSFYKRGWITKFLIMRSRKVTHVTSLKYWNVLNKYFFEVHISCVICTYICMQSKSGYLKYILNAQFKVSGAVCISPKKKGQNTSCSICVSFWLYLLKICLLGAVGLSAQARDAAWQEGHQK